MQTAAAFGVDAAVDVHDSYPCIINADEPTAFVTKVCLALFGKEAVLEDVAPMPGAEVCTASFACCSPRLEAQCALVLQDFSYFGQEAPGCFFQLGGGTPDCPCPNCHQANYDYNDDITPIVMGLWVRLVEARFLAPLYPEAAFFPELPTVEKPSLDKFVAAMRG